MYNLTSRQSKIVKSIVNEYINSGLPVGSSILCNKYRFNISPATIRNEMSELERLGFLYQPHISAGRVPTDKGYRYFIDTYLKDVWLSESKVELLNREIRKLDLDNRLSVRDIARIISNVSGYVTAVVDISNGRKYDFGLNNLLRIVKNDENLRDLCSIAEVLDYMDDYCEVLLDNFHTEEFKIYVGSDNPICEIRDYSMIVSRHSIFSSDCVTILIGPKNMKYNETIAIVKYIKNFC